MRVRVTAVNADGATNARSEQTAVVESNAAPLNNTARPTITGEARVGQELTASEGTWTGNPTSFAFQWQRCDVDSLICANVIGATGRTYGVRIADLGFRLRVEVTARTDNRSGTATSNATAVVVPTTPITNRRPTHRVHLGALHGSTRVRTLPDLRRHTAEPGDSRHRVSPGRGLGQSALRHPRCPEAVCCLYAELASRAALPRGWSLHDHPSGAGYVWADERSCSPDVQPLERRSARFSRGRKSQTSRGPRERPSRCSGGRPGLDVAACGALHLRSAL